MHGGLSSAVRLLFETGAGFVNPCERGTSILWRERYRGVIVQSEPGLFESADLLMRETWEDWNALPLVAWVRKRGDELTRCVGDGHDTAVYLAHTSGDHTPYTHLSSGAGHGDRTYHCCSSKVSLHVFKLLEKPLPGWRVSMLIGGVESAQKSCQATRDLVAVVDEDVCDGKTRAEG
jgi:hypothetical protein